MFSTELFIMTGASLLFLFCTFVPMEKVFPAKSTQAIFRPQWFLDLCFFLGQYLLWGSVVLWVISQGNGQVFALIPDYWRAAIHAQPWWLQFIEMVVLSDLLIYWAHRLQHKVDFLWRFHKVHHTSEHLDWLAAHREHPLDSIYTIGLINLPAIVMGFPVETVAGFIAFRGIWAIYIHSNVRLPIGPLKIFIGAPQLHHWHHDLDRKAGNYANISPLMDLLFGTYVCPDHEPERLGIYEKTPKHYLGQLLLPLLPRFILKRF